jgi:hypothetical protein
VLFNRVGRQIKEQGLFFTFYLFAIPYITSYKITFKGELFGIAFTGGWHLPELLRVGN